MTENEIFIYTIGPVFGRTINRNQRTPTFFLGYVMGNAWRRLSLTMDQWATTYETQWTWRSYKGHRLRISPQWAVNPWQRSKEENKFRFAPSQSKRARLRLAISLASNFIDPDFLF